MCSVNFLVANFEFQFNVIMHDWTKDFSINFIWYGEFSLLAKLVIVLVVAIAAISGAVAAKKLTFDAVVRLPVLYIE